MGKEVHGLQDNQVNTQIFTLISHLQDCIALLRFSIYILKMQNFFTFKVKTGYIYVYVCVLEAMFGLYLHLCLRFLYLHISAFYRIEAM